jgi:hypothetical protein
VTPADLRFILLVSYQPSVAQAPILVHVNQEHHLAIARDSIPSRVVATSSQLVRVNNYPELVLKRFDRSTEWTTTSNMQRSGDRCGVRSPVTPITMSAIRLLVVAMLFFVPSASLAGPTTCLTWSQWIARGDAAKIIKCVNDAKPYTIPDGISALTNLEHL